MTNENTCDAVNAYFIDNYLPEYSKCAFWPFYDVKKLYEAEFLVASWGRYAQDLGSEKCQNDFSDFAV